jgi:aldehyde dehydrogenase (NAD+)
MTIYQNLIAGEWIGTNATKNINPSDTNEVVGLYADGSAEDTRNAIAAAKAAFPAWSRSGIWERHVILKKTGDEIMARKDELGALLAREEGKTLPEATGEVIRASQIFEFFAGEALRLAGEVIPSVRPNIGVEITREALGVIGIITPWNFPIAIPAWKIAPALAFGNCVVLKPADLVPGSAWALSEIISRSGIPAGVFNLVMGRGSVIGNALVNHPAVQCVTNHKKVQLEMGGKNPQVVLDDADLAQAVELSVQSAFYSTGQRCTASSRLIVTEGIYPKFIAAMKERMAKIKVGDALAQGTDMGPVSSKSQLDQDMEYVAIGKSEGATLAAGGELLKLETDGYYMSPALFSESAAAMRINKEEIFGPVASVIRVKNYEEALATANDTEFGLSAGIATTSLKYATHFKRHSQAGMVMVNLPTAGVDYHVPFGGRKGSSYGPREQGRYAQEFFTTVKTAYTLA